METRLKYFSFIKIPAWLSAEFADTMFLLTGDLGIFDKATGEDPVSHAIAQPRFNISHLNLSASISWGRGLFHIKRSGSYCFFRVFLFSN